MKAIIRNVLSCLLPWPCHPELMFTSRNAVHKLNVSLNNETMQSSRFLLNPLCHDLLWSSIRNSASVSSALHCKCLSLIKLPSDILGTQKEKDSYYNYFACLTTFQQFLMRNKVADLRCFVTCLHIILENYKLIHFKLKCLHMAEISGLSIWKPFW